MKGKLMTLNDYLYSGDTIFQIMKKYSDDLRKEAKETQNEIDRMHADFIEQLSELWEDTDFLLEQSRRVRGFCAFISREYPELEFTFKGRIKSLIRAEEKFNGYIVSYIYEQYKRMGSFPPMAEVENYLTRFRDLVAYRIVISLPAHHLTEWDDREEKELEYLYSIANVLPEFLQERGFIIERTDGRDRSTSELLDEKWLPYYRDYICNPTSLGYRSLHIAFYDKQSNSYVEVQMRTKEMDDYAEIGPANHSGYTKNQEAERAKRMAIPIGDCVIYDEAYDRGLRLQQLEFCDLKVNMFAAVNNSLINDGCGLFRGRAIQPYEHLSR